MVNIIAVLERPSNGRPYDTDREALRPMTAQVTREDFDSLVRDAVEHLYDRAFLQGHPLGKLLCHREDETASELQRLVVDIIEQLRPGSALSHESPEWRRYFYAQKRYVEGDGLDQIRNNLAIGERQSRRYNHEALRYISSVLWSQYSREGGFNDQRDMVPRGTDNDETLVAEVANVSNVDALEATPFSETLSGVFTTIESLLEAQRITLDVTLPANLPPVAVPRVILRQILLGTLVYLAEKRVGASIRLTATGQKNTVEIRMSVRQAHSCLPPRSSVEVPQNADLSESTTLGTIERLVELQNGTLITHEKEGGEVGVRVTLPASPSIVVLVIDDNLDFRRLFQRFLEGSVYSARYAEVTDDVAQLSLKVRPDIIILDVMMPTLDGWEVLHRLKSQAQTRQIPVIVCSVLNEPTLAKTLGAADVLVKPIARQELLAALDRRFVAIYAEANQDSFGGRP